jgi:hypothetical protein
MSYHVIIEGSSSANTYSDESGKSGFTGRIDNHLRTHCEETKRRANWDPVSDWVYLSNFAQAGKHLPIWAELVPNHMGETFSRSRHKDQTARLGIFVLEGHPLMIEQKYDKTHLRGGRSVHEVWRDSLETIKDECFARDVKALFVQMPPPERSIGRRGLEVHQKLVGQVVKTCISMDGDATFVSVADMLGDHDPRPFIAEDRMHPNARGHELIFRNLIPIVYEQLNIKPHFGLPNPEEVFEPSFTP